MTSSKRPNRFCTQAFTLVELLVVIGIIALLISILLPALNKAQRASKTIQCAANLRTITQGMIMYTLNFKGAIPGSPWTSAAHVRGTGTSTNPYYTPRGVARIATNTANMPGVVSYFDWVSPTAKILGLKFNEGPTGADRQSRFTQFLRPGVYMCPENTYLATAYVAGGAPNWGTLPVMSYVTSTDFMHRRNISNDNGGSGAASYGGTLVSFFVGANSTNVPQAYEPRIGKIGTTSQKVFLSEGSRFIDANLTYTYNAAAADGTLQHGGSHSDQRPYVQSTPNSYNRSRIYLGRYNDRNAAHIRGSGRFLLPAFRHGTRSADGEISGYRMNCAFFDGHVETLSAVEVLNPILWSPRGMTQNLSTSQVVLRTIQQYFNGVSPGTRYVIPN